MCGIAGIYRLDGSRVDRASLDAMTHTLRHRGPDGEACWIAPDGSVVEQVPTGDRVTTNIAFGGPELKTAYITLSGKGQLIAMDWARPGLPLNFLNK